MSKPKRTDKKVMAVQGKAEQRETCLSCSMKHIAQSRALSLELCQGYPHHYFWALGHLAEAADECVQEYPWVAQRIREIRLAWTDDAARYPDWKYLTSLIHDTMRLSGELPKHL